MRRARIGIAPIVLVVAGASAFGHVRLRHSGNGAELYWANPHSIRIVISSAGSDDIAPGLHFPALRNAIAAWNSVPGSRAHLTEDATPAQQARTDWDADGLHQVLFDEANDSGYFPAGSGIVAITPVWFAGDGRITDADILFNGSGYGFTTSGEAGSFDVEDVAAHELGHFLGLDHSGWAGATMYPYVATRVVLGRSLSRDDQLGMRDAYPSAGFAAIRGTVRRASDDTRVAGAHVVARDASGRTAAGAIASGAGAFELVGLEPGTYTLFATPLDFPVSAVNLGPGHTVDTDFESTLFGEFTVRAGQTLAVGSQRVDPDVSVSLGRSSDRYPLRCTAGQTRTHSLRGAGLAAGSTLASGDPSISVDATAWFGNAVTFEVTVQSGAEPGHTDLTATSLTGEQSILVAALEITPEDPTVASVVPGAGSLAGGTILTIEGTGFAAGARVVIGDVVYPDGQPDGCTVVDPQTIHLVTAATVEGLHDVVVIDPSGMEGRLVDAFLAAVMLRIDWVSPPAGSTLGGDRVTIRGAAFSPRTDVVFGADAGTGAGGTAAERVTWIDAETLEVVTPAHTAGPTSVLVRDSANGQAYLLDDAFRFASSGGGGGGCAVSTVVPPAGSRMHFEPLAGSLWLLLLAAIVLGRALRASRTA